jgi:hypothetical protein
MIVVPRFIHSVRSRDISHAVDLNSDEVLCPLCKGVANALLPFTPSHVATQTLTESAATSNLYSEIMVNDKKSFADERMVRMDTAVASERSTVELIAGHIQSCLISDGEVPQSATQEFSDSADTFAAVLAQKYHLKWVGPNISDTLNTLQFKHEFAYKIRRLHSFWSAAASGVLSRSQNPPHGDSTEYVGIDLAAQLLFCARSLTLNALSLSMGLDKNGDEMYITNAVTRTFVRLLTGQQISVADVDFDSPSATFKLLDVGNINSVEYGRVIQSVPFSVVSVPNSVLTPARVSKILRLGIDRGFVKNEAQTVNDKGAVDNGVIDQVNIWGIFLQPLLSQDLSVVAMAAIGLSSNVQGAKHIFSHLVLARLVQVLIEPCSRNVPESLVHKLAEENAGMFVESTKLPGNTQFICQAEITAIGQAAKHLQSNLLGLIIGVDEGRDISGKELCLTLLVAVLDAWLPFLEYISAMMACMQTARVDRTSVYVTSESDSCQSTDKLLSLYLSKCMGAIHYLFGPNVGLTDILSSSSLGIVSYEWIKQLRNSKLSLTSREFMNFENEHTRRLDEANMVLAVSPTSNATKPSTKSRKRPFGNEADGFDFEDLEELEEFAGQSSPSTQERLGADAHEDLEGAGGIEVPSDVGNSVESIGNFDVDQDDGTASPQGFTLGPNLSEAELAQVQMMLEAQGQTPEEAQTAIWQWMLTMLQQQAQQAAGAAAGGGSSSSVAPDTRLHGSKVNALNAVPVNWKLLGVDPTYPCTDSFLDNTFVVDRLTNIHAVTPLQGCVSGLFAAFGVNGERISDFYCELSHCVGFGGYLRHHRNLVNLPNLYTDIYQMVRS